MEQQTKLVNLKELPKNKAVFRSLLKEMGIVAQQRCNNVVCRLNQLKENPESLLDDINKLVSSNSDNANHYETIVKFPDGSVRSFFTKLSPLKFGSAYINERYYNDYPFATLQDSKDAYACFLDSCEIDICKKWFSNSVLQGILKRINTLSIQFPVIAPEQALSEYSEIVSELNSWSKDSILVWAMKNHKKEAAKAKSNC